jgi:putative endonuclease
VQHSTAAGHLRCVIGTLFDWLRDVARRRRWHPEMALGRRGEDLAHRFLRRQGYTIVARNYRLGAGEGEADLIAWEGDILVIVEVKTRSGEEYGPPERAMGEDKRSHLRRVARAYARKTDTPTERVRFDLVTVVIADQPRLHPPLLQLMRNAFSN